MIILSVKCDRCGEIEKLTASYTTRGWLEWDVVNLLRSHGYAIVDTGDMDADEQVCSKYQHEELPTIPGVGDRP